MRKYKDSVQSEKISINEVIKSTFFAVLKEKRDSRKAKRILPPSKLDMGSRFNIPRKREEKTKSFPKSKENKCVKGMAAAHKRFTAGPAAQINISLEKEPSVDLGTRDAPKGDNLISRNLTLDMRAAAICPSSCRKADKKQAKASNE